MAKFRPLRDQILVRPLDRLKELSSVIEVVSDEKDTAGEVVAVGPGSYSERDGRVNPMTVKVGDRVRYGNGSYLTFPKLDIDGERFLVIREVDIAWIEPAAA